QFEPDRDVPGRARHRRGLLAAADPGRRLRLRRPHAYAPDHRHERGGRLRGHRDRGPAGTKAGAPPPRDRAQDPGRAHGREAGVAARRSPDFLIIARTNGVRASTMDDALRRGELYKKAGADVLLLSMAHRPEQLRAIAERLGGPLMYLNGPGVGRERARNP